MNEIVSVARHLDLSFDGKAFSEQLVPLATGIDGSPWVSAVLSVMIHSLNLWATSDTRLRIEVHAVELSPDEPDVVFEGPPLGQVEICGDQTGPGLFSAALATTAAHVRVRARWIQADTEGAGPQTATISVQLIGRCQAPRPRRGRRRRLT